MQSGIIPFITDEERWKSVVSRKAEADGHFFYGVKTTGIFCRPACASRLPNRGNVEFFETWRDAELRGFRACKRCRPKEVPSAHDAIVRACKLMDSAGNSLSLDELATAVGLSPSHFHRQFKKIVGLTPKGYASARRAEHFRENLHRSQTVTQAIYNAGFGASSRCYESVSEELGMTPTEFQKQGARHSIRYDVVPCRMGWIAVAATDRGICLVELGDHEEAVRRVVLERYSQAVLIDEDAEFRQWVREVVSHIEVPKSAVQLPLDIQGTAFQRKVWAALQTIPVGTTVTYMEIAKRIGSPSSVRAVGSACAANQLAVVIPCHRVVRSDGGLSGYRWGVERKRQLLDHEEATSQSPFSPKKDGRVR